MNYDSLYFRDPIFDFINLFRKLDIKTLKPT